MSGEGEAAPAKAQPVYPDEDQEVLDAIAARTTAGGRYPDQDTLEVMEQTVDRLVDGATLLVDTAGLYARARDKSEEFQPDGFMFLARVLAREVERLYRLYHGRAPHDR